MKIICIARNYAAHAEELDRQVGGGTACPPEPAWFLKPDTALLRNNDPFYIPAFSQEVHYECELVVRINRVGKGIAERFAHRYYDQVGLGPSPSRPAACNGRPSPKGCRGSAARRSTARRPSRPDSYLCRSWAATCSPCTSRWR